MRIDSLQDLRLFAEVSATGGLSSAGRAIGLSPAAVSKRLARLEEALGARLLNRTTRSVSLTDAGREFLERCHRILAEVEEAEEIASADARRVTGQMKLSLPATFGRMHISPYLPEFMERYPDLELRLTVTDSVVDIVEEGIDVAVRIAQLSDSSLVARKLADNERVMVAAPAYLERHGTPQRPEELANHNCLRIDNQTAWRFEAPDGDAVTVKPTGSLVTNNAEFLRHALLAGRGVTMKSRWDVGPELKSGALVEVLPDWCAGQGVGIFAVYPSAKNLSAKVRAFIDFLLEKFHPTPPWKQ